MSLEQAFRREQQLRQITRRHFLRECALGAVASGALGWSGLANAVPVAGLGPMAKRPPHFMPRARRVIYLHMAGAPSQHELFDYKPELAKVDGQDCPASFLAGKRFAFITGVPKMLGPQFPFPQYGQTNTSLHTV